MELKGIGRALNEQTMAALKQAWMILGEVIRRSQAGEIQREEQIRKLTLQKREADTKKRFAQLKSQRIRIAR